MKNLIITVVLVSLTLFSYAESREKKVSKKIMYEKTIKVFKPKKPANELIYSTLIDIRPLVKPEEEIKEDTEFINALSNKIH